MSPHGEYQYTVMVMNIYLDAFLNFSISRHSFTQLVSVLGNLGQLIFWNSHNHEWGEILTCFRSRMEMRFCLPKIGSFLSLQKNLLFIYTFPITY